MELFLDDELPKPIKIKIKDRFQELEEVSPAQSKSVASNHNYSPQDYSTPAQAPSMQRLMQQNPDLIPKPPVPVTPAAAQALANRQALLQSAGSEKPENGRRSPRKM